MLQVIESRLKRDVEAAQYLGLKVSTLRKWRTEPGRGPRFRKLSGSAIRYDLADLNDFINSSPSGGEAHPAA